MAHTDHGKPFGERSGLVVLGFDDKVPGFIDESVLSVHHDPGESLPKGIGRFKQLRFYHEGPGRVDIAVFPVFLYQRPLVGKGYASS